MTARFKSGPVPLDLKRCYYLVAVVIYLGVLMNTTLENSVNFADKARDVSGNPTLPLAKSGFTTQVSPSLSQDSILGSHKFIERGFTPPHYDPEVIKSLQEKADKFAAFAPQFMTTKANYQEVGELQSRFEYQQAMISGMTKKIISLSQQTESISTELNTPEQFREASQKLGAFSREIGAIEKLLGGIIDSEESAYINDSKTGFARNNKAFCKLRGSIFTDIKQLLSECKKSVDNADDFLKDPDFFARQVESLGEARAAIIERRNSNGGRSQIAVEQAESEQVWNVTTAAPSEESLLELLYGDEGIVEQQSEESLDRAKDGAIQPQVEPAVLGLSQLGNTQLGGGNPELIRLEAPSHELDQNKSEIGQELNEGDDNDVELGDEVHELSDPSSSLLMSQEQPVDDIEQRIWGDANATEDDIESDSNLSIKEITGANQETVVTETEMEKSLEEIQEEASEGSLTKEALAESDEEEFSRHEGNNWISRGVRDQEPSPTANAAEDTDIEDAVFEIVKSEELPQSIEPEGPKYVEMHGKGGLIDVLTESGWYSSGQNQVAVAKDSESKLIDALKECAEKRADAEVAVKKAESSFFRSGLTAAQNDLNTSIQTFSELVESLREVMQQQLDIVSEYAGAIRRSFAGQLFTYNGGSIQEPIRRAGVPLEFFGEVEDVQMIRSDIQQLVNASDKVTALSLDGKTGSSKLFLSTNDGREIVLWEVVPGRFRVLQTDEAQIPRYCGSFWATEGRIEEVLQSFIDGPAQIATLRYVNQYADRGTYRILGPNETPYIQEEW
jgi:hypothetical protein